MKKQLVKIPVLSDYIGKEYELVKDATVHRTFLPKGTQFKIKKISQLQVTVSILKGPFEENILDAIENDRAMNHEKHIFDLQASIDIWEREPEKFICIFKSIFEHIDGKLGYYAYKKRQK